MFNVKDPFVSMLAHAFIGAFAGTMGGLIMVSFINLVVGLLDSQVLHGSEAIEILWPAMSMGAVVGSILGGVAGLRKTK